MGGHRWLGWGSGNLPPPSSGALSLSSTCWCGSTVPSDPELPVHKQKEFAEEWRDRSDADRKEATGRLGLPDLDRPEIRAGRTTTSSGSPGGDRSRKSLWAPTSQEWELRWRAGAYLALRDRVNREAADDTIYPPRGRIAEPDRSPQLGALSLVVRERNRWTARILGWLTSWNSWAWRPGADGSANPRYLGVLFVLAFGLAVVRGVFLNACGVLCIRRDTRNRHPASPGHLFPHLPTGVSLRANGWSGGGGWACDPSGRGHRGGCGGVPGCSLPPPHHVSPSGGADLFG